MAVKIKITITQDQELFRSSLAIRLKQEEQFDVIGEAANSKDLVKQLKNNLADVILLDYDTPDSSCFRTLDILKNQFQTTKVIVIGSYLNENGIAEIMAKGANCYMCKCSSFNALTKAIHSVHLEGFHFDQSVSKALLMGMMNERSRPAGSKVNLKVRELEVLKGICDGKSNKEIAQSLNVSSSTVDFHRTRIRNKTKCRNTASIIKYALKNGLISFS